MSASQIFLIVVSGLGVIHGLFLAIFLWAYRKGNPLSNKLLSILLIVLSFRVGKSVFLEFAEDLDAKFIFIGLGTMMAIGPLFYLYAVSCIQKSFKWSQKQLLHFVPAIVAIAFGFWVNDMETMPPLLLLILFISYYGHYIGYLIKTYTYFTSQRRKELSDNTFKLLRLLFFGLLIVWVAYVLNLFDEIVPYVAGPVLYSVVAYLISFILIQKGYIQNLGSDKYRTTPVSEEQMGSIFSKVVTLVEEEKQFRDPDLTLKSLSLTLGVSPQVLSMVINRKGQKNFNNFINQHRVNEAIRLFNDGRHDNLTISTIAFEAGFNSISSFNSAFKKQTDKTPQVYRQQLMK
ncbi:MAG: helix-turn-helix domain-containing protein [Cyclobacteriaceae bacterium]